jgi:hypothetical protein
MLYDNEFFCDGNCGATVVLTSQNPDAEIGPEALRALGWLVADDDTAFCPECQDIAERIQKTRSASS